MKRAPLVALATLLAAAAGCRAPRPSSIERWSGCVIERGHVDRSSGRAEIAAGSAPVLYLHARWGDSLFVSEYSWGELLAELDGLGPGAITTFTSGAPPSSYREGSEALVFDTDRVQGTARVVKSDAREVVLQLDLVAASPTVDLLKRSVVPARGTITAARVASTRDCK